MGQPTGRPPARTRKRTTQDLLKEILGSDAPPPPSPPAAPPGTEAGGPLTVMQLGLAMDTILVDKTDWRLIEIQFRCGLWPNTQLATMHGVPVKELLDRARAGGWGRDMRDRLDLRTRRFVVDRQNPNGYMTEAELLDYEARLRALVTVAHRTDIAEVMDMHRAIVMRMQSILHEEILDESGRKIDPIRDIKDLKIVTSAMTDVTASLERLVQLEANTYQTSIQIPDSMEARETKVGRFAAQDVLSRMSIEAVKELREAQLQIQREMDGLKEDQSPPAGEAGAPGEA